MPPSTKKNSSARAQPTDEQSAEALVARCGRSALEQLVLESLHGGRPVSLESIAHAAAAVRRSVPPVEATESMENAGPFSLLPVDALVSILDQLNLPTRLAFAIEVCKGLRPLRSCAACWRRLALSKEIAGGYSQYESIRWINGRGLLRLARWLPDCRQVEQLRLHVSKPGFDAADVCSMLAGFPDVQTLQLTGQGVVKKILVDLSSVARPKVRELIVSWGQIGLPTILAALKRMPNLDSLVAAELNGGVLAGLASQQREARGGGTPLLTRLRQMDRYADKLSVYDGCAAATLFPELVELVISFDLIGPEAPLASHPLDGANLRRLHLYRMIKAFAQGPCHLSSGCLATLVRLLVARCPRLEALCLSHGCKYVSRGEEMPPLPRLGDAFSNVALPRSLVMLHLQEILVAPEDFEGCELPQLTFLRIIHCGEKAAHVADALRAACPRLRKDGCVVVHGEFPKFKDDDCPNRARSEAMYHRFPTSDLAGLSLEGVIDVLERGYWM